MKKAPAWNQYQIKLLMAFLMVLDHLDHVPGLIPENLAMVFHVLSRSVAVWFAYCVVEGVRYTHDLRRYLLRLYLAAGGMLLGNLALRVLLQSEDITVSNNIFLTLALGATMLAALQYISRKPLKILAAVGILAVGSIVAEGGLTVLPFMLIAHLTYGKPRLRDVWCLALSAVLLLVSFAPYDTLAETLSMLAFNSDFLFILVLPILHLYNGQRGTTGKFGKYFFYVFYPAHLWLLALAAYWVS